MGCVTLGLTAYGTVDQGFGNFALNIGVEGMVTLTAIAVIGPLVRSNQEGIFRFHPSLNYRRFLEQTEQARRQVQILTTFTPLLQEGYAERFLLNVRRLLRSQVQVEVLVANPDSLTMQQRQRELAVRGDDVMGGIHENIQTLHRFVSELPAEEAAHLSVRIYDASASVIMHRWDDRSLISFLPTDRLAEEGSHLEIPMNSPIGAFVEARYSELWSDAATISLDEFMTTRLTLLGDGRPGTPLAGHYVTVDGAVFVASPGIIAAQALHRERALQVHDGSAAYDVVVLDPDDTENHGQLLAAFRRKYGKIDLHTLVRLHRTDEG
ncbi:hypothetical protein ABT095_03270 [Kitasatospora sp. NPDC002227]|uniref:hypothetical protein n=1 Tax=Kitasatospora sp. NPDC002227 TaxID=3154773 RepID=UPI0033294B9A